MQLIKTIYFILKNIIYIKDLRIFVLFLNPLKYILQKVLVQVFLTRESTDE